MVSTRPKRHGGDLCFGVRESLSHPGYVCPGAEWSSFPGSETPFAYGRLLLPAEAPVVGLPTASAEVCSITVCPPSWACQLTSDLELCTFVPPTVDRGPIGTVLGVNRYEGRGNLCEASERC